MSEGQQGLGILGYRGSHPGKPGIYLELATGEWLQYKGGLLPGAEGDRYLRIPAPLVILLGPLMGALYVVSLSFVGFLVVVYFLGQKMAWAMVTFLSLVAEMVLPAWVPGRGCLAGYRARRKRAKGIGGGDPSDRLEKLAREIEQKREVGG